MLHQKANKKLELDYSPKLPFCQNHPYYLHFKEAQLSNPK